MAVHNAQLKPETKDIAKNIRIAIVVAEFNETITQALVKQNVAKLHSEWFEHVDIFHVPWAFEVPAMTSLILDKWIYNVIMTLGCVIKWSTPHFDYVCKACTDWITELMTHYDTPIIFWVLTCDNEQQARERINDNYAIYALNYITQRSYAQQLLDHRYEELMNQAWAVLQDHV